MHDETYFLEAKILGTVLANGNVPDLSANDFQNETYRLLWTWVLKCVEELGAVDHIVLADFINDNTGIDKGDYLRELADDEALSKDILMQAYVDSLKAKGERHTLADTLSGFSSMAESQDPRKVKDAVVVALRSLQLRSKSDIIEIRESLRESIEQMEKLFSSEEIPGIRTGFPKLDEKLGGWQNSDLTLLAARPAVGKTAMMCNMALSTKGKRVGIVSTEQPAVQITNRLIAMVGRIAAWKFRSPKAMQEEEWHRLTAATMTLMKKDITIFDSTSPTVGDIERAFETSRPDILFVDYAQRIHGPGDQYERISGVASGLKDLARNWDIPVIALAQINRQGAKNAGMEHLKGSGDLEQEADEVLILAREDDDSTATLTVEKNRHGPTGTIDLFFDAPKMIFSEAKESYEAPR